MLRESIKVRAPATVANVSCGFDCLGYAISDPADIVTISKKNDPGIDISISGMKADTIPTIAENNTAGKALLSFLEGLNIKQGFKVHIKKGIHPGSGLGSSAASAVAAVFGANILLGSPLKLEDLLIHCMQCSYPFSLKQTYSSFLQCYLYLLKLLQHPYFHFLL